MPYDQHPCYTWDFGIPSLKDSLSYKINHRHVYKKLCSQTDLCFPHRGSLDPKGSGFDTKKEASKSLDWTNPFAWGWEKNYLRTGCHFGSFQAVLFQFLLFSSQQCPVHLFSPVLLKKTSFNKEYGKTFQLPSPPAHSPHLTCPWDDEVDANFRYTDRT